QQINDICLAGRYGLPYVDGGKLRIRPLSAAPEFLKPAMFTEKAFLGALKREPTSTETTAWVGALDPLITAGNSAALLTECQTRVKSLFMGAEYLALATSDEQFIEDLYAGYLARKFDQDGKTFWLHQLTTGMTRSTACDAFGSSIEFSQRVDGMLG